MLWKNLPSSQLWYKIVTRLVLDQIAALRSLVSGRPNEFLTIIKAHLHFIFGLAKVHRKRKLITRNPDTNALHLFLWFGSILSEENESILSFSKYEY